MRCTILERNNDGTLKKVSMRNRKPVEVKKIGRIKYSQIPLLNKLFDNGNKDIFVIGHDVYQPTQTY